MRESEHILITGSTGTVGLEVLRWMSLHRPGARLSCLVRAASPRELAARWCRLLSLVEASLPGAEPLAGDITAPDLGLPAAAAHRLKNGITAIIHAAAQVKFLAPLDAARAVNVAGTGHVLDFAARCPRLERFAHVSSAFVAGRRSGVVLEDELEHSAGFASTYEQSKYEAELLVRRRMPHQPVAVYRLGLLAGRASDGYVHEEGAFHKALRLIYSGNLPVLPGSPESSIDLLPTDAGVDVLLRLFFDRFTAGSTYHIANGARAVRLPELVAVTAEAFHAAALPRHRAFQPPRIVAPDEYEAYIRSAAGRLRQCARLMDTLAPHLVCVKVFDCRSAHAACEQLRDLPPLREYYPRIVRYCIRNRWERPAVCALGCAAGH